MRAKYEQMLDIGLEKDLEKPPYLSWGRTPDTSYIRWCLRHSCNAYRVKLLIWSVRGFWFDRQHCISDILGKKDLFFFMCAQNDLSYHDRNWVRETLEILGFIECQKTKERISINTRVIDLWVYFLKMFGIHV